jgi:conjugal transfer pilus assembly protein TraB
MIKKITNGYKKLSVATQQLITALGTVLLILGIILVTGYGRGKDEVKVRKAKEEKPKEHVTEIETTGKMVNEEEIWRYGMKKKHEEQQEKLEDLNQGLSDISMTLENVIKKKKEVGEGDQQIRSMQEQIDVLTDMVQKMGSKQVENKRDSKFKVIKVALERKEEEEKVKNVEDSIPAGAFAKAVLLSGVDASTSLSATSEPKPILVRIIDTGTLPRKFKSDLKDCHIIASGYGDISSERVYGRLENLSCVERSSGEVIETEVAGYIAGEDGRVGVKGEVIEKGRGYIGKSVIGGVLQGVAGIMNPGRDMGVTSVGGVSALFAEKQSAANKFKSGMSQGMSSSMDRLSKYYIDRAESISPVVQIASGRIIDVVFTEGADIGTAKVKKKLEMKRIESERESERQVEQMVSRNEDN